MSIDTLLSQYQRPYQQDQMQATLAPYIGGDWLSIAQNDPSIQLWWSSLQAEYPDLRGVPLDAFLLKGQELFAGGQGRGYDTKSAIEAGHRPMMIPEDYRYHWIGQDPTTGYYYKGKEHPTRYLSEQQQE